jgi:hypothetical protein
VPLRSHRVHQLALAQRLIDATSAASLPVPIGGNMGSGFEQIGAQEAYCNRLLKLQQPNVGFLSDFLSLLLVAEA